MGKSDIYITPEQANEILNFLADVIDEYGTCMAEEYKDEEDISDQCLHCRAERIAAQLCYKKVAVVEMA